MQHYPHRYSDVSRAHLCKLSPLSTSSQNIQTYRIQRESQRAIGLSPQWTFLRRQRKSRASFSVPGDHHKSEDQKFIISVIEKQKAGVYEAYEYYAEILPFAVSSGVPSLRCHQSPRSTPSRTWIYQRLHWAPPSASKR
jgi:hypothetical protein